MILTEGSEILEETLVLVPLFPPQIPHGMSRDRTPVSSTMTRQRLTVGVMARTNRIRDKSIWDKVGIIIDSRNPKHFVHDVSHIDCPGI
jgi:hypothetical protein